MQIRLWVSDESERGTQDVTVRVEPSATIDELARALDLDGELTLDGRRVGRTELCTEVGLMNGMHVAGNAGTGGRDVPRPVVGGRECWQLWLTGGLRCGEGVSLALGRHIVGRDRTADVVLDDPTDAFLLPKYGPLPYVTILVSYVFVAIGIGVALEQVVNSDHLRVESESLGTLHLAPKQDDLRLIQLVGALSMLGLLIGVPFILDYLTVATPPVSFLFQLIAFCYVAAGLGWIGWSIYSYRRKNGFTLVPIELIPGEPRLGEPFTVRLKQPVRFSGMIERLVLEMVLTQVNTAIWDIRRDSDSPDPVLYSTREVVIEAHPVDPDEVLEIGKSFVLPSNLPPSSAPDDHSKFQFIWTLHLRGKSNKRHILKRDYVLDILPSEHRPPKPRLI